jgi:hypothetical protein
MRPGTIRGRKRDVPMSLDDPDLLTAKITVALLAFALGFTQGWRARSRGKGLFLLWLVLSTAWIAFLAFSIANDRGYRQFVDFFDPIDPALIVGLIVPPLILLAIGAGHVWQSARSANDSTGRKAK